MITSVSESRTPLRVWIPPVVVAEQHEQSHHVMLWQVRGAARISIEDEPTDLVAGQAVWIPVRTRHEFTVQADSVTMPLFFDVAGLATILRTPTRIIVDRDLRTLLLAYMVAWNSIIKPDINLARQILARIEGGPAFPDSLPMPTSSAAREIAEALHFNPGDIRTVEELASSVYLSPRSIERAFRAETGMTLRQWRIRNRIAAASVLLRSGASISAVAHRVGYTNLSAFRRVFLAHVGMTATEFTARFGRQ